MDPSEVQSSPLDTVQTTEEWKEWRIVRPRSVIISFPFECPLCDKKFRYKADIGRHLVVHGDQRIYKCLSCAKGFNHKCNLKSHIRDVHGSIQLCLKCPLCPSTFTRPGNLKKHNKQFHL